MHESHDPIFFYWRLLIEYWVESLPLIWFQEQTGRASCDGTSNVHSAGCAVSCSQCLSWYGWGRQTYYSNSKVAMLTDPHQSSGLNLILNFCHFGHFSTEILLWIVTLFRPIPDNVNCNGHLGPTNHIPHDGQVSARSQTHAQILCHTICLGFIQISTDRHQIWVVFAGNAHWATAPKQNHRKW